MKRAAGWLLGRAIYSPRVRAGLNQLENSADIASEVRRTRPLTLGRRLGGRIDNIGEVLAITEGEDYR